MIGTYLKELLKNHNRVIVPDLGAFLKKNDNPDLLYFNEFLRFNDGLLVDFIAEKEEIDKIEAAKRIKNYVADINNILKNKQPVDLKDIGTLYLDNTDKIQLKIDLLKAYIPDESTVSEVKETKKAKSTKTTKEEKIELPIVPVENKPIEPIIDKTPEIAPQIEEKKPIEKLIDKPIEKTVKTEYSEPVVQISQQIIKPKKTSIVIPVETSEKKRSGIKPIWIFVIILLIALFLVWFYIIQPRLNKNLNAGIQIANDSTVVTTKPVLSKPVKIETPTAPKIKTNKTYYIVVGCFAMESNADRLISSLKQKGINAEKFTKLEEMYFVGIASSNDKATAEAEMSKIKEQGFDCWLKLY
jgi:cell division septation protein DedD